MSSLIKVETSAKFRPIETPPNSRPLGIRRRRNNTQCLPVGLKFPQELPLPKISKTFSFVFGRPMLKPFCPIQTPSNTKLDAYAYTSTPIQPRKFLHVVLLKLKSQTYAPS